MAKSPHAGHLLLDDSGRVFIQEKGAAALHPASKDDLDDCPCCRCLWFPEEGWAGKTLHDNARIEISENGPITHYAQPVGYWMVSPHTGTVTATLTGCHASKVIIRPSAVNDFGGGEVEYGIFTLDGEEMSLLDATKKDSTITSVSFGGTRGEVHGNARSGVISDGSMGDWQAEILIAGKNITRLHLSQSGSAAGIVWDFAFCGVAVDAEA